MTEQQIIETLATKVMEWVKDEHFIHLKHHKKIVVLNEVLGIEKVGVTEWNPLQNLADAWQVVEKLLENYLLFDLSATEDGWQATFKMIDTTFINTKEWEASGDTPQEAICTAAMELVA
ncbi:hypothetical protein A616_06260 [Brevibacillus brevis X23]|nr:hypothetical protein A616_06260 [Brevibacillus brevis X23]